MQGPVIMVATSHGTNIFPPHAHQTCDRFVLQQGDNCGHLEIAIKVISRLCLTFTVAGTAAVKLCLSGPSLTQQTGK